MNNFKQLLFSLAHGRKHFSPKVKKIVEQYGEEKIVAMEIRRYPLPSAIDAALRGMVKIYKVSMPYEKLYHLSVVVHTDRGNTLLIEKNQNFNMETTAKDYPNTDKFPIHISNPASINEMLEKTVRRMGESFFTYQSLTNNCQKFMVEFLAANHLSSPKATEFIMQVFPSHTTGNVGFRKTLNTITDMGNRMDIVTQGGQLTERLHGDNGLSNKDIERLLSQKTNFGGVYSKDKLPRSLKHNYWYVVNMQNYADGSGTHWVCFKYGNPVTYFDAFGIPPPMEIMRVAKRDLMYSSREIQSMNSTACGWFCVACILSDSGFGSTIEHYNHFTDYFSKNTGTNDKLLRKLLHSLKVF